MRTHVGCALLLVGGLTACDAPEAPEEFDELVVWLYENHPTEDPAYLEVGMDSLVAWIEAEEEMEAQYSISSLSADAVNGLDDVERSTEGLVGMAVVTGSDYTVAEAADAMIVVSIDEVYPEFVTYQRQWLGDSDPDCFMDLDCDRAESLENYEAHYEFNLITIAESQNQYVWVQAATGATLFQRNWLTVPPDVNQSAAQVEEQMYLNLFVPRDSGGHWRLQATWMDPTLDDIDQIAINAIGRSMRTNSETLEAYFASR